MPRSDREATGREPPDLGLTKPTAVRTRLVRAPPESNRGTEFQLSTKEHDARRDLETETRKFFRPLDKSELCEDVIAGLEVELGNLAESVDAVFSGVSGSRVDYLSRGPFREGEAGFFAESPQTV